MKKTGMWLAGFCTLALLLPMLAVRSMGQDKPANVAGTWELTMAPPPSDGGGGGGGGGRRGGGPQNITFKQDGAKLTGSMAGRGGDITFEGTVSGNNVTWSIKREFNGNTMVTEYKATVDGENMKGTATTGDRPARDFTAKRTAM
ncbi:MAG: hypothetical protein ACRD5L_15220 [Bryobacteraceae bacterium]